MSLRRCSGKAAARAAAVAIVLGAAGATHAAPGSTDTGKVVYTERCAVCHGDLGDGKGKGAYLLYPRPRAFTSGVFKFRSTSSGSIPRDEDLFRTVTNGLPGTGMPAWGGELSEQERWDVIAYLKTFSDRFKTEKVEDAIAIGTPPPESPALVEKGKVLFDTMKCWDCHGKEGKGDGPSSGSLRDSTGVPLRAYDFTLGGRMKGGATVTDVYRTFSTGLDGTPMPSFGDVIPEADRWSLSYYVLSLGRSAPPPAKGGVITAAVARGPLPVHADDPSWDAATATEVPLRPLWTRAAYADRILVKALYDDDELVMRLEWKDEAANADVSGVERFRDAVAAMFPILVDADGSRIEGRPALTMGDAAHPVNVWHWKADWQADIGAKADALLASPGSPANMDTYMGLENDPAFKSGVAAGNPISALVHTSPVESLVAAGFGTLTSLPPPQQDVAGEGVWRDGSWVVVMRRPLFPEEPDGGAVLDGLATLPVAFAVWDGGAKDRNGTKVFSEWTTLAFAGGPLASGRVGPWYWVALAAVIGGLGVVFWLALRRRPAPGIDVRR